MNKTIVAVLLALAFPAWAHDGHEHGSPQGAPAQQGWWLDLVPRAAAAQRMEIDEGQGLRFIRADGLPNHATGAFPNRSNPNRISAQSYYFRVALRPGNSSSAPKCDWDSSDWEKRRSRDWATRRRA